MAALVESVKWRDSRRGNRFLLLDLSDSSGQFSASCFEEDQCNILAELAKQGGCALLNVELDQRSDDENPRVAIRQARPLEGLEKITRTQMELELENIDGLHELANLIAPLSGGKSELIANIPSVDRKTARVSLGRAFRLDAETAESIGKVPGIANVKLGPATASQRSGSTKPNLRLVS